MATDIELTTKINTANSAQALGNLRKSLKDLINLQGQVSNSKDFEKLSKAINETEGKIGDLTDSFNTLKGSGLDRVTSSIGLLKECFTSVDTGKIGAGFKALGSAMSAIPIFLLVEGLKYLYENFEKVTKFFGIGVTESEKLTAALEKQKKVNEGLFATQENEIKILQAQGASIDAVNAASKRLSDQKIKAAKDDIELQKLKIREILLNDSVTESLQRTAASVLRAQGNSRDADRLDAKINQDKLKRAAEFGEQIRTDLITINNLQTEQKVKEITAEKKHIEDLKKLRSDFLQYDKDLNAENEKIKAQNLTDLQKQLNSTKKEEKEIELQELSGIEEKYNQINYENLVAWNEKERQLKIDQANYELNIATQSTNAIANLSDTIFAIKFANLKKGSAEEDKAARNQFKINKSIQITAAVISGIQGVLNALTAKSVIPEPYATGYRIASSVAIGTAAAASVAKIAAMQYQSAGGGGSTPTPSTPSLGGVGGSIAPPPTVTQQNQNVTTFTGNNNNNVNQPIKVYLPETDIKNATSNADKIRTQATF